jgi:hypothetical protein
VKDEEQVEFQPGESEAVTDISARVVNSIMSEVHEANLSPARALDVIMRANVLLVTLFEEVLVNPIHRVSAEELLQKIGDHSLLELRNHRAQGGHWRRVPPEAGEPEDAHVVDLTTRRGKGRVH